MPPPLLQQNGVGDPAASDDEQYTEDEESPLTNNDIYGGRLILHNFFFIQFSLVFSLLFWFLSLTIGSSIAFLEFNHPLAVPLGPLDRFSPVNDSPTCQMFVNA